MTDDIVTRLHFAADEHLYRICKPDSPDPHGAHGDICHEQVMTDAADEIERLRHIIEAVNTYLYVNAFSGPNEDGDEDNNYPIIRMEIWFQQLLKEEARRDCS